jgi:putative chitinase
MGNTQPGDGWRFRGRGLMQLTGRANYERFARLTGATLDDAFLASLTTPLGAAESAAHFWAAAGCNDAADAGDIARVRRIVNGGTVGLADVQDRYRDALAAIN